MIVLVFLELQNEFVLLSGWVIPYLISYDLVVLCSILAVEIKDRGTMSHVFRLATHQKLREVVYSESNTLILKDP